MALPAPAGMTLDEYLTWEPQQELRHEFMGGEVYAMTGGRLVNSRIALAIGSGLRNGLRGSPCRVYVADARVHVQATEANLYPDVVVSCHPEDAKAELSLLHPCTIVEVLSPSTASHDRGSKFAHYRQIAELQDYLLVDPDTRSVELFARGQVGTWIYSDLSRDERVTLCGVSLEIAGFFEDLPGPAQATGDGAASA